MPPEEHVVDKEMGYTRSEFMRLLPKAVDGATMEIEDDRIRVADGNRTLRIRLGPESERRLGNFRLPTMKVSLIFSGYSESQIEAALDRFWRAFQKGGG